MTFDVDAAMALADRPTVVLLARRFAAAGHRLVLVGGSVRDALAGADVDDLDFGTDAQPGRIAELVSPCGPVWDAGARFGTVGVQLSAGGVTDKVEITTFRSESYRAGSRRPDVTFAADLSADLARRDLTINAVALDVATRRIVDPYGGIDDLAAGRLRTPGDPDTTMSEDPLRQVRVVRFAATRQMTVDPAVAAAVRRHAGALSTVARERLTAELRKLLAAGPAAVADAIELAGQLTVDRWLFGRLDTSAATVAALRRAPADTEPLPLLGDRPALRSVKLSNDEVRRAVTVSGTAGRVAACDPDDRVAVRRLARFDRGHLPAAAAVVRARGGDPEPVLAAVEQTVASEPQVVGPLPVDGHDLVDRLDGPAIGAALRRVEEALLASGRLTRPDALTLALANA